MTFLYSFIVISSEGINFAWSSNMIINWICKYHISMSRGSGFDRTCYYFGRDR